MGERVDVPAAGCLDLHVHSTFSDGSENVDTLVADARRMGLAGLAVTDHDSLEHLSRVRARARELGFPVLAGLEATAFDPVTGRKVHLLGFSLESTEDGSGPLERIVNETLAQRVATSLWQAWSIIRAGITYEGHTLSLDEVCSVAGESTGVYKQHVMQALCGLPYPDERYQKLYRSLFKGSGVACRDFAYPPCVAVVHAIREQGGVAVLAHPGQMNSWGVIPALVAAGLQGIEAHHPDHTSDDVRRAHEAARQHGLFVTGGSDYHGRYGAPRHVGSCFVSPDEAGPSVRRLFEVERTLR
jgi:predicted metal-dependent phosphoesterase TrpH